MVGVYITHMYRKAFSTTYLKTHHIIHSDEQLHHCVVRKKSFSNEHDLKMGQHIHSVEAPYHCDAYAESFSMKSDPTVCEHIHS